MDHDHGHGDMDMGKCSMNMLFTFSTKDLCIVFPQWRVTGLFSLLLSLLAVVVLVAGYEALREFTRRYELSLLASQKDLPSDAGLVEAPRPNGRYVHDEGSSLLYSARSARGATPAEQEGKVVRAALYAAQVFYSFFIMLLFMTYNGWVMLAVAVGAFVGFLFFGGSTATKSVSCH